MPYRVYNKITWQLNNRPINNNRTSTLQQNDRTICTEKKDRKDLKQNRTTGQLNDRMTRQLYNILTVQLLHRITGQLLTA